MNRLMLRRKRMLIQKRKRALIQKRKKQLQIKNKKNNNESLINTVEENIIIDNKFNLITTIHDNMNHQRIDDFIYTINHNLNNNLIESITIFFENIFFEDDLKIVQNNEISKYKKYISSQKIYNILKIEKIHLILIKKRPTYKIFFDYCNQFNNKYWILCNCDIYFPIWNQNKLKKLLTKNYNKSCFVLTRYNIFNELKNKFKNGNGIVIKHNNIKYKTMHNNGSSIDSWIFKTPFKNIDKINLNIEIGRPECDGMMNYQLSRIRNVFNPCLSIISIHKHINWTNANYNMININGEKISRKKYNNIMTNKGFLKKKIRFTKI